MTSRIEKRLQQADEDQVRMMDELVILTDYYDNAIGAGSKKDTHIMENINKGMLHRAFSVFLFTPDGKLVLQQRSPVKITFPEIWANTCCSHPLYMQSELIEAEGLGVKNAARRKLEHELGIPPEDVPLDSFTWITRVHYVGTSGDGLWGEHEIDWILMCTPKATPRMKLNPNEVAAVKSFSQAELKKWMATRNQRGDQVSPWFDVMEKSLLYKWWDAVLAGRLDTVLERDVIHRQHDLEARAAGIASMPMPPAFSANLAATTAAASKRATDAVAASIPGSTAQVPKQGAYGKVRIHSESKLSQAMRLSEVWAAIKFKAGFTDVTKVRSLPDDAPPASIFCEKMLCKVSRSFAMVIQQLPDHLRTAVCIFYLVLRGLDTVEDDMQAFIGRQDEKLAHLRAFHKYLLDPAFRMAKVGEGDEAYLLEHFYHVNAVFASLPAPDREVISDICARMGEGMASYCGRDLREGTTDIADYSMYCHYVAGLVGEGLSRLFVTHGDEDPIVAQDLKLADDMGLFLQKTNIIRDYLEDLVEGRAFWPREVWGQYSAGLSNLRHKVAAGLGYDGVSDDARFQEDQARACLNHLVADALTLAPSCLRYMARLRTADVFRFCAIPQVMAIATLDKLTNNPDVYTGVVKIRKAQALKLMMEANSMESLYDVFLAHSRSILKKIPAHHKEAYHIATEAATQVEAICLANLPNAAVSLSEHWAFQPYFFVAMIFCFASIVTHLHQRSQVADWGQLLPRITDSWDVFWLVGAILCILYLIAVAAVPLVLGHNHAAITAGTAQQEPVAGSSSATQHVPPAIIEAESAAGRKRMSRRR